MYDSVETMDKGQRGSLFIEDTAAHTGTWGKIHALEATTFTTLTSANRNDGTKLMVGTLANITLTAGDEIYGVFTAITLATGSVIAYEI